MKNLSGTDLLAMLTLLYCLLGSVFLFALGVNPIYLFRGFVFALPQFVIKATAYVPGWVYLAVAAVILVFGKGRKISVAKLRSIIVAIIYCTLFTLMFGLVKNQLPEVVPFWADALLAELDRTLHFGRNPWDLLSGLSAFNTNRLAAFYLNGWVFLATFLPVLLIAFDKNETRVRHFVGLWALAWVLLGNVVALVFMSAGPIFAGLMPGVDPTAHAGVVELLARPDAQALVRIRDYLWGSYSGTVSEIGSGISAFPSVHVGIASVIGLYLLRLGQDAGAVIVTPLRRRAVLLGSAVAAFAVIGAYLVLSVYLGWHYAVDGYTSLLIISGSAWLLQRKRRRAPAAFAPAALAAE
ncbi:phosphatase PAP2 family protein [Celeribacter neptunius]|nr:phosphatase PAP2 family protein [Celeribacter neptunius]